MKKYFFFLIIFSFFLKAQYVYKTPSGEKYHFENCRMVENVSSKLTIQEAKKRGLLPCKICNPLLGSRQESSSEPVKVSGTKPTTTQCVGKTKAGTRCKHKTSIANGYCFQHQP